MHGKRWIVLLLALAAIAVVVAIVSTRRQRASERNISGAVLIRSSDPRDRSPISGVEVTAQVGPATESTRSDAAGFFRLQFHRGLFKDEDVTLRFAHEGYIPLEQSLSASGKIEVIYMTPARATSKAAGTESVTNITNVRVRYASKNTTTVNVGSTVKSFEVVNTGNMPCDGKPPCSPNGKWKATLSGISLDAGDGNEFGNARVSCIAGPCPFTAIDSDNFSAGGRRISVSVRNWSDTTTFLIEAEVFRTMTGDAIRRFYPIIFGHTMTFTLPPDAQGLTIEADLNGTAIVFPLGPELNLSWGTCSLIVTTDHTKRYQCDLKPGYRFS